MDENDLLNHTAFLANAGYEFDDEFDGDTSESVEDPSDCFDEDDFYDDFDKDIDDDCQNDDIFEFDDDDMDEEFY